MRDLQWLQRRIIETCSAKPDHVGAPNFHLCLIGTILRMDGTAVFTWRDVAEALHCKASTADPVFKLAAMAGLGNDKGMRWGHIPWALKLLPAPIPSRASSRMPKKVAEAIVAAREPVVEWPAVTPADPIPSWIDDTLAAVKVPDVAGLSLPAEGELIEV